MEQSGKDMEERLRETFSDTLDKSLSLSAVLLSYDDKGNRRTIVGVPYSISNGNLEVGPYFKIITTSAPENYDEKKLFIPVNKIAGFARINLADVVRAYNKTRAKGTP